MATIVYLIEMADPVGTSKFTCAARLPLLIEDPVLGSKLLLPVLLLCCAEPDLAAHGPINEALLAREVPHSRNVLHLQVQVLLQQASG
jgi:hypothetical protein